MKTSVQYKASTDEVEAMRRVVRFLLAYYLLHCKQRASEREDAMCV
jgi:hypothetical protein